MPDDTYMTREQFLSTRSSGLPTRVVASHAEFLTEVGNGGSLSSTIQNPIPALLSEMSATTSPLVAKCDPKAH